MRLLAVTAAISSILNVTFAMPAPQASVVPQSGNSSVIGNMNSFSTSCYGYRASQSENNIYLSAICLAKSDSCLYNNFGHLEARKDGNFGYSCDRMVQHGESSLYGYCNNGKEPVYAVIDLGAFVENYDGHLSCFGYGDESQNPTNT